MEDLLLSIVKDAQGTKLANLKQAAQIAHGKFQQPPKALQIFKKIKFFFR